MLGYWPLQNDVRNYGVISYGKIAQKEGQYYNAGNFNFSGNVFMSFQGFSGGELLSQGDVSIGLIGLKNGVIPYLKKGSELYKPDTKFAKSGGNWAIEFKKEQFADKDYIIRFYAENSLLYTNGVDNIEFSGNIIFPLSQKFKEFKVFNENQIEAATSPKRDFFLFGATSGSISSGIPLFMGSVANPTSGSVNLSLLGLNSNCYLLDESGHYLLSETGEYLYAETCPNPAIGMIGGFDMFISGNNLLTASMPLYLQQSGTANPINSGIPLYMDSKNYLSGSVSLYISNQYSGIGSGVLLYIEASGLNDGYVPITSGIPLYLHRSENVLGGFNMTISGGTLPISGSVNLTLEASIHPISGSINMSIPYVKDSISGATNLYTIGY